VPVIEFEKMPFVINNLHTGVRHVPALCPLPKAAEVHGLCTLVLVEFLVGRRSSIEINELRCLCWHIFFVQWLVVKILVAMLTGSTGSHHASG
jgi:hypothetical protein